MTQSKSLRSAYAKLKEGQLYTAKEAVKLMKDASTVKFDATAEIHFNLGIDPRHADQQIRTTTTLPHGTGQKVRILVITSDERFAEAKKAGASEVGGKELIEKIAKGYTDFDKVVATPDQMRNLAKVARILGPKGLMPSPKAGTVSDDLTKTVSELVAGRIEFRNDKQGNLHTIFGKLSFTNAQLEENLVAMIKAIQNAKPAGQKGIYFKNVVINSTMGMGIPVDAITISA